MSETSTLVRNWRCELTSTLIKTLFDCFALKYLGLCKIYTLLKKNPFRFKIKKFGHFRSISSWYECPYRVNVPKFPSLTGCHVACMMDFVIIFGIIPCLVTHVLFCYLSCFTPQSVYIQWILCRLVNKINQVCHLAGCQIWQPFKLKLEKLIEVYFKLTDQ